MSKKLKLKRGFTIIEVVLVLAIAGLIFLMVFIALPALQRSQRNTQRRDDYSMLVTAVNSYMSSNNGKLNNLLMNNGSKKDPNTLVASRWVNSSGEDPNGNPYEVKAYSYSAWHDTASEVAPDGTLSGTAAYCSNSDYDSETTCTANGGTWNSAVAGEPGSQVFIVIKANCNGVDDNGDPKPASDNAMRSFAVYGYLEGGGYFCQDSGSNS